MDPPPPGPFRVKRKPVAAAPAPAPGAAGAPAAGVLGHPDQIEGVTSAVDALHLAQPGVDASHAHPPALSRGHDEEDRPPLPQRRSKDLHQNPGSSPTVDAPQQMSSLHTAQVPPPLTPPLGPKAAATTPAPSLTQSALASARDLAARLRPLPTTTTKHYTVALHSPPLVLYRGPHTSVSLTVFSSPAAGPLPPDRTLWLQQRGFSGDAGARLKAFLGATGSWLHVTPERCLRPEEADPAAERDWTRDIARVARRLARHAAGGRPVHVPRETHVVRIPAAAEDGYFRVVVCRGGGGGATPDNESGGGGRRHVLCASPVFRVASTSSDVSIFRGASLKTLPLEVGAKVMSTLAGGAVSNAVAPAVGAVQSRLERLQPGFVATQAGLLAYSSSGLEDKVDATDERISQDLEDAYRPLHPAHDDGDAWHQDRDVVGPDDGPQPPYPIKFQAKVAPRGAGRAGGELLGVPTVALRDVPDEIKLRLKGVYFGWACVLPKPPGPPPPGASHDWHEAIITALPAPKSPSSVLPKTVITAHVLHDGGDETFLDGAKMKIIVMGFLRPASPADRAALVATTATAASPAAGAGADVDADALDEALDALSQDAWVAVASLSREHWGPEPTLKRMETAKSARSLSDKYVAVREKVQRRVDSLPAHWAGIRTRGAELRDRAYGTGGYWIAR